MLLLPAVSPARERMDGDDLSRWAQEVADRIAAGRGLRPLAPIRTETLNRDQLVEHVRRRLREETPPEELRAEGVLLERLGLIAAAEDYEEALYDLYEQQVAGLYDPDDRTTYVLDDLVPAEADLTLWHEIVHALQDQHFSIGERQDALEDDGDRSLAFSAVCEGDATLTSTALQYDSGWPALEWLVPRDLESLRAAVMPVQFAGLGGSSALLEYLSFPYVEGVAFVRRHLDRGGTAAVDALLRRPPESTEQVIHPEKYGGPDVPVRVRVRSDAFPGWDTVYEDTAGEFVIRLWLGSRLSRSAASTGAAGWGGDRVLLLAPRDTRPTTCLSGAVPLDDRFWACGVSPECGGTSGPVVSAATSWVVWATVWDPAPDGHPQGAAGEAVEFLEAAARALGERLGRSPSAGSRAESVAAATESDPHDNGADDTTVDPPAGSGDGTAADELRFDGPGGVAAVRRDGRWVWLVLGPPGEADRAAQFLEAVTVAADPGSGAGSADGTEPAVEPRSREAGSTDAHE